MELKQFKYQLPVITLLLEESFLADINKLLRSRFTRETGDFT